VLKKKNRVSARKEISELRGGEMIYQSPIFGLVMVDKKDEEKKFLFVVSKRISKKAVDRNRIRRVLSEVIRLNLDKIRPGVRLSFLVRRLILEWKWKEIKKEVEEVLGKRGLVEER